MTSLRNNLEQMENRWKTIMKSVLCSMRAQSVDESNNRSLKYVFSETHLCDYGKTSIGKFLLFGTSHTYH